VDFGQCVVDCDVTHYLGAAISSHNRPAKYVDMTDVWRHTLAMLPLDPVDLSPQDSPAGTPIRWDHPGWRGQPRPAATPSCRCLPARTPALHRPTRSQVLSIDAVQRKDDPGRPPHEFPRWLGIVGLVEGRLEERASGQGTPLALLDLGQHRV